MKTSETKSVAIILLGPFGDIFHLSAVFSTLKHSQNPKKIFLTHIVEKTYKKASEANLFIDQRLIFDKSSFSKIVFSFIKILFVLNKQDLIFCFHGQKYLNFLLSKIFHHKYYYFSHSLPNTTFRNNALAYKDDKSKLTQAFLLIEKVLSPLEKRYEVVFHTKKRICFSLPGQYIVCAPGAGNCFADGKNKKLPAETFANKLRLINLPVVFLGTTTDAEDINAVANSLGNQKVYNLCGQTDIDDCFLIIKNSQSFFGNDSSLTFLAAAAGVSGNIFYGPTSSDAFFPFWSKLTPIIGAVACSPCYRAKDGSSGLMYNCTNNICMKSIK